MSWKEKFYSSYISTRVCGPHDMSPEGIRRHFPDWMSYFKRALPADKGASILDVGCGFGGFLYFLQTLGYKNVSGVDISPEQVEEAKRLGLQNVFCCDLLDFLGGKDNQYEAVFALDVIEHFGKAEILRFLEVVLRALKPGGVFAVKTSNAASPFGARCRYYDFTHELSFTESSLGGVLLFAGFQSVSLYPAPPVASGLKSGVRLILWKFIERAVKFYMVVESGSAERICTNYLIAIARK